MLILTCEVSCKPAVPARVCDKPIPIEVEDRVFEAQLGRCDGCGWTLDSVPYEDWAYWRPK